jgi:hypothetical protein
LTIGPVASAAAAGLAAAPALAAAAAGLAAAPVAAAAGLAAVPVAAAAPTAVVSRSRSRREKAVRLAAQPLPQSSFVVGALIHHAVHRWILSSRWD